MAYTKKEWVDIANASSLSPEQLDALIPRDKNGVKKQDALCRLDAANMNRIEEGIENAHTLVNELTADDVGAVALHDNIVVGTKSNHSSDGGIRFGIRYTEEGIPLVGMGTQRGSNSLILTSGCDYTNLEKEMELGQRCYYFPVEVEKNNEGYPAAIKISNYDGKAYVVKSSSGRKYYAKNEIIPMSEHEILHTGNAPTLVSNAISKLPISKGGTGGTTASGAANSLGVKSIGGGIAIKEGDNLNSYTTIGNYVCSLTAIAQSLSNCPVTAAFTMTVGSATGGTTYLYQEVTHFSTGVKYYRTYTASNGEWTDWNTTYTTSNKPSKTFNVTIDTDWEPSSDGGFEYAIYVKGITGNDNPIVDVVLGEDIEANKLYLEAWGHISRITTMSNNIILYAYDKKPETAFNIQLKVVY